VSGVVLVTGAPFSGCSLVAQLLGGHPNCAAAPELSLSLADTVDGLLQTAAISQVPLLDGLLRFIAEYVTGGQHDAGIAAAEAWLDARRAADTVDLLEALGAAVAPRRLVIPDPDAALRPDALMRWQRLAPDLQVVHCLRHPLTHGAVWAPWLQAQLYVPPDYRDHSQVPPPVEPQIAWLRCNRNVHDWLPAEVVHRLRMEDLETDPDAALGALGQALGLDDDHAVHQAMQALQTPFSGWGPPAAPGGLEAEVLMPVLDQALPLTQPTDLDQPLPWRSGVRLDAAVIGLARAYGYG
jgi:hypothetical protein